MAIGLAFKAFFQVLFKKEVAQRVATALAAPAADTAETPKLTKKPDTSPTAKPPQPTPASTSTTSARSDALTLLSTLQREARFLDLVGESLDGFEDAQVGAAARQVLSDVRKSLDRMFALAPIAREDEGSSLDIPRPASPTRYKIVGRGSDQAKRGTLVHRGWQAERSQLPSWNGSRDDALVLSPIEIEVDG